MVVCTSNIPGVGGLLGCFDPGSLLNVGPDLQWFYLSITVSLLVIIVYGMVLGISRAFSFNELERFSKAEILNAFATVLMVIFLISTIGAMQNFSMQYFLGCTSPGSSNAGCPVLKCGGADVTIADLKGGIDLLTCRLSDKANAFATLQQEITTNAVSGNPFSVFNRMGFYLGLVGAPIFSGQYVGSWFKEAETYRLLNSFITTFLIGANTLVVAAQYVKNNMLSFYLPLGLLLRAFPYTRAIGAFFMALALGLYFVYPVLYIITDPGFVKPTVSQAPPLPNSVLCYPTFSSITYSVSSSNTNSGSGAGVDLSLNQLANDISSVYTSLLLQPFIVFAITIVFIRYMTTILGGESADLLRAVAKVV